MVDALIPLICGVSAGAKTSGKIADDGACADMVEYYKSFCDDLKISKDEALIAELTKVLAFSHDRLL